MERRSVVLIKPEREAQLYLPCYDVINNEIYFSNFFTEEIIEFSEDNPNVNFSHPLDTEINKHLPTTKQKQIKRHLQYKEKIIFKECLQKFQATWLKIKILSRFNNQSLNSKEIYNYFKRPLYSRFLLSENKKLYSFNSCIPIPRVLTNYQMKIEIEYDQETLFGIKKEEKNLSLKVFKDVISLISV